MSKALELVAVALLLAPAVHGADNARQIVEESR